MLDSSGWSGICYVVLDDLELAECLLLLLPTLGSQVCITILNYYLLGNAGCS